MSPNIPNSPIPVYRADRTIYASVTETRLARLVAAGLIDRVISNRHGRPVRAVLFAAPDDPTPPHIGMYQGTRYSYIEKQKNAPPCWQLKRLHDRSPFVRVIEDCLVP